MPKKEQKKSEFAKESEALAVTNPGPSAAMVALFQSGNSGNVMDTLVRKNMPQMIKAVDGGKENIPVGGVISGVLVDVVKSPVSTIKGSLLWLHLVKFDDGGNPEKTGVEITFPATGVIRSALAPGQEGEDAARKEMLKLKGHLFVAQRMPNKMNSKYKKEMTTWDVRVSEKPVDLGVKIN